MNIKIIIGILIIYNGQLGKADVHELQLHNREYLPPLEHKEKEEVNEHITGKHQLSYTHNLPYALDDPLPERVENLEPVKINIFKELYNFKPETLISTLFLPNTKAQNNNKFDDTTVYIQETPQYRNYELPFTSTTTTAAPDLSTYQEISFERHRSPLTGKVEYKTTINNNDNGNNNVISNNFERQRSPLNTRVEYKTNTNSNIENNNKITNNFQRHRSSINTRQELKSNIENNSQRHPSPLNTRVEYTTNSNSNDDKNNEIPNNLVKNFENFFRVNSKQLPEPVHQDVIPINHLEDTTTEYKLFNSDDEFDLLSSPPEVIYKPGDDISFTHDPSVIDDFVHKPVKKNKNKFSLFAQDPSQDRSSYEDQTEESKSIENTKSNGHGYVYEKPKIPFVF